MKGQKYEQFVSTYEKAYVDTDHSSSQNKTDSSIAIECRICLQEYGPFITPCKCGGTMRFVHEICLKKWACEKVKKQVQKDEEKAKGRLSPIHGVECELCREIISMEVQKKKVFLNWTKAKENSQDNFLPFVPLFLLNSFLALACFTGIIFVGIFSMLIVFQHEAVDYKKYIENPLMTFGLLGLSLILCGIFMAKSMIQLYYMFVKEEHEVIKFIPSMAQMTECIKETQPDQKTKQYHTLETMSTPTTPHSISQILLQNQLSLTRKNFTLKKKIAKEIAQRKLAKLPEFKNENEADNALNQLNQINFGVQVVFGNPQK